MLKLIIKYKTCNYLKKQNKIWAKKYLKIIINA